MVKPIGPTLYEHVHIHYICMSEHTVKTNTFHIKNFYCIKVIHVHVYGKVVFSMSKSTPYHFNTNINN